MAETQAPLDLHPQRPGGAWPSLEGGVSPPKKPFVARLAAAVAGHAYWSLAAIIVLTLLVVGLYVYYHGFFFLGPYAHKPKGGRAKKGGEDEAQGDPETERLIDSINQH